MGAYLGLENTALERVEKAMGAKPKYRRASSLLLL